MERGQIQSWFWTQEEIWELCAFEMSVDSFAETLLGFGPAEDTMKWNLWETFFRYYSSVKTFHHLISNLLAFKWLQQQQAWQSELLRC